MGNRLFENKHSLAMFMTKLCNTAPVQVNLTGKMTGNQLKLTN